MRKFALSFITTAIFIVYSIHEYNEANEIVSNIPSTNTNRDTPITQTPPKKIYHDGEYIGEIADAYYGQMQVKITIKENKIIKSQLLKYPNDRQTSIRINKEATPRLIEETIRAQSAQIDIVTGATQTSLAYKRSLESALSFAEGEI